MTSYQSTSILPDSNAKTRVDILLGRVLQIEVANYDENGTFTGSNNVTFQFDTEKQLHDFLDAIEIVRMAELQSQA